MNKTLDCMNHFAARLCVFCVFCVCSSLASFTFPAKAFSFLPQPLVYFSHAKTHLRAAHLRVSFCHPCRCRCCYTHFLVCPTYFLLQMHTLTVCFIFVFAFYFVASARSHTPFGALCAIAAKCDFPRWHNQFDYLYGAEFHRSLFT